MKYTAYKGVIQALLSGCLLISTYVYAQPQLITDDVQLRIKPMHQTGMTTQSDFNVTTQPFEQSIDVRQFDLTHDAESILQTAASDTAPPVFSIALNNAYKDTLTADSPEHWYAFSANEAGKVTVIASQIPSNMTYKAYLYSKPAGDASADYTSVGFSTTLGALRQQIAATSSAASDYILVIRSEGENYGDSFVLTTAFSTKYDDNEPNDNFWQATNVEGMGPITGQMDNMYDLDVFKIEIPTQKQLVFALTGEGYGNYKAELFNANGQSLGVIDDKDPASATLSAGTYYWAVRADGDKVVATDTYTLTTTEKLAGLSLSVTTDEYSSRRIDYGQGDYFALKTSAVIKGQAINSAGEPIATAKLKFEFQSNAGKSLNEVAWATTDDNGNFELTVKSPADYGRLLFYGPVYTYHYDLHALVIYVDYGGKLSPIPQMVIDETSYDGSRSQYTTDKGYIIFYDISHLTYHG
ncbi:hypothetical protein [Vibrio rhizosphaerae]|uniref:hypothetical protein n=1 Tax=Vibrio rhizosphaerae TaxID=398736 RepID=UPI000570DA63|nr:hypothetical protein [Vibrio rhizosphaerae]